MTRKIGKYEIVAVLGTGSMGKVYRARDSVLDREVALKTVAPELLKEPETFARFQREARAAARLHHPNIVTVFDLGEVDGMLYIAMELLEGLDLAEAIEPPDRLSLEKKLRIMVQVAQALDYAHKRGVVHRDVKPANIRLIEGLTVKLVDFGVAHLGDSTLTQTGIVLGTPSYMAPEVLRSGRVDHRADVWAVGVILYELLAGQRPFDAPSVAGLIYQIVHAEPRPLEPGLTGLPARLGPIVARALAKNPAERYQEMAEVERDLTELLGLRPASEAPPPVERSQRYESLLVEARSLLARAELDKAYEAARQAQALEPSSTRILALVDEIETRLQDAPTLVDSKGRAKSDRVAAAERQSERPAETLAALLARGATAFRERGTFGEPPTTTTACLSPVCDQLAAAGTDGAIRLWDLVSRSRSAILRTDLHRRAGHDAVAVALAYSTGGRLLASGHVDGSVHLWDVARAEEVRVKLKHDDSVGALAFSPDDSVLASGSVDSTLKLWDVKAAQCGEARREMHRQPGAVTALVFARSQGWLLTGHTNRLIRAIDAASGRLQASLREIDGAVSVMALAPDGNRLLVASQDRTLRLFDLSGRRLVSTSEVQRRAISALAFFPAGRGVASVSVENTVTLWDLAPQSPVATLWGAKEEAFAGVACSRDGRRLAAALVDGRIRLWELAS